MYGLNGFELARVRREELLREADSRRFARALRENRNKDRKQSVETPTRDGEDGSGDIFVRWGLAEDEPAVAELLELNGIPRWVAFEERFVVAVKDGQLLGALRYRTESKRLLLGLLAVDPWAGEERLALALYAGAGRLARVLGVEEVVASASRADYLGGAGYRRWGRGWRLEATQVREAGDGKAASRWRRILALFGELPVPFHRYR